MPNPTVGLLVMAYGTPRNQAEIEPYYTHIRRGHKPPPHLLQDLIERYEAIGGVSPLARITEQQAAALEQTLNDRQLGATFKHYLGYKHIDPFIEDAVAAMHNDGITEAVSIVLAPHFSTFSVKSYNERAVRHAETVGNISIQTIDSWYDEPKFIQYWAEQIQQTFVNIPQDDIDRTVVIFSAHSLPEKIIQAGDPYPEQLKETADLIAKKAGIEHYAIGWQSESDTGEPWLGPDVQDLTRDLYEQHRFSTFIYCPVGFVSDHLEVLYDNDVECKVVTDALGAAYYRPEMPNTNELFIDALADAIVKKLRHNR